MKTMAAAFSLEWVLSVTVQRDLWESTAKKVSKTFGFERIIRKLLSHYRNNYQTVLSRLDFR